MEWDDAHLCGTAQVHQISRSTWTVPILSVLAAHPHAGSGTVHKALNSAYLPAAPLVGSRRIDLHTVSRGLGDLVEDGLVVRDGDVGRRGGHPVYDLTFLGEGFVDSLRWVTRWAVRHRGMLVEAVCDRDGREAAGVRDPRAVQGIVATDLALGLVEPRWSNGVLWVVYFAPSPGIGPAAIAERVGPLRHRVMPQWVVRDISAETLNLVLRHLQRTGLVERITLPQQGRRARVLYRATAAGELFMEAMWHAGDWGMRHVGTLSKIVERRWPTLLAPEGDGTLGLPVESKETAPPACAGGAVGSCARYFSE